MKNECTELVFILDRSGSMAGLESDTIGGFNGMLDKQKQEPGEAVVTTVLFDDKYELLHDRIPLRAVSPMTDKQYYVRGCTALLDAIGRTISKIDRVQNSMQPEYRAGKVMFVITTDGFENASREFSWAKVKELVEQKRAQGWEFLFLGANIDAISTASRFGIAADRAVRYHADSRGTQLNYASVCAAVKRFRNGTMVPSGSCEGAKWKEDIEEDFRSRQG